MRQLKSDHWPRTLPVLMPKSLCPGKHLPGTRKISGFTDGCRRLEEKYRTCMETPPHMGAESNSAFTVEWITAFPVTVALLSPDCWHWQPWFEIHNNGSCVVVSLCETTWVCVRPSLAFSRHPGSSLQINFQIFVPVLGTQRWKRSCTSIFFASLIVMTNRRNNQNIFHKATQSYQVINIMQPLKYKATLSCLFLKQ